MLASANKTLTIIGLLFLECQNILYGHIDIGKPLSFIEEFCLYFRCAPLSQRIRPAGVADLRGDVQGPKIKNSRQR